MGTLLTASTGLAQPAPSPVVGTPNWDVIRKAALNPVDRQTVTKWVTAQIDQLAASADPAKASSEFYKEVTKHLRAPDAAAAFRDIMAQVVTDAFTNRYQQTASAGKHLHPMASVYVLMTLRETGPAAGSVAVTVLPACRATLADPAPAVRCQATTILNALRTGLTPAARSGLIADVQKAAAAENYPMVLGRLYEFLQYVGDNPGNAQELPPVAKALTDVLDARLGRIEKQGEYPAAADADAVAWLAGKATAAPLNAAATQSNIARLAGRLLADAGYLYANQKPPQPVKLDLERIVVTVEGSLATLCKAKAPNAAVPSPGVADAVLATTPDQAAKINAAVGKWIGSGQIQGALNAAFNLPPGLGIQRPAPTTSSTPAS